MKKSYRWIGFVLLMTGFFSIPVHAEKYTFIVEKQEQKAKTRWSLAEWLETRDRMRLMDLWLALHSPSPYEFYLGGNYQFDQATPGGGYNAFFADAAAYASIFGLGATYEKNLSPVDQSAVTALFFLRIFGYHAQGTHITLHLGLKNQLGSAPSRAPVVGAGLGIYLGRFFGIDGYWRHFFLATPHASGVRTYGNHYEGGAFIEFKFLRFYLNYFFEQMEQDGVTATQLYQGAVIGTRFYF